eukprot:4049377-Karenia_brevis.AAC.1
MLPEHGDHHCFLRFALQSEAIPRRLSAISNWGLHEVTSPWRFLHSCIDCCQQLKRWRDPQGQRNDPQG